MYKYKVIAKKGEGTFSEVLKAQSKDTAKFVAIKKMKARFESMEQVNNLREVQALRRLSPHAHVIKLIEIIFEKATGTLALVFELMEMNLYELIKGRRTYLPERLLKTIMWQLLKATDHMHRNGIFHRDIKPENVLIRDERVKLCDFGSCRGIRSKQPFTEYISTRWYRAPECLLTDGYYNYKMDIWGVGCVWFEILSLFPLFPGTNELDQIQRIHNVLGTPPREVLAKMRRHSSHMNFQFPERVGTGLDRLLPNANPEAMELISRMLAYNPDDRITARAALLHPYFRDIREMERIQHHGVNPVKEPNSQGSSKDEDVCSPKAPNHEKLPAAGSGVFNNTKVNASMSKTIAMKQRAAAVAAQTMLGSHSMESNDTASTASLGATRFPQVNAAERTKRHVGKPGTSPSGASSGAPLPALTGSTVTFSGPPRKLAPAPAPRASIADEITAKNQPGLDSSPSS